MECSDARLIGMRQQLLSNLQKYNPQFAYLSKECQFKYLLLCHEKALLQQVASYVNKMLSISQM